MKRFQTQTLSSTQHYYHFLLGLVVPLVLYREDHDGEILIGSVGPLDRIIHELAIPGVRISDEAAEIVTVRGYDHPDWFDLEAFRRAAALICSRLSVSRVPSGALLIRRDAPDPFYVHEADIRGASALRRSIPNHDELAEALPSFADVSLEHVPLATQAMLFSTAPVVVAQHGASLANMIWMQPGSSVVEIMPREYQDEAAQRPIRPRIFPELAACLGIKHKIVLQDGRHGAVDVEAVRRAVEDVA